MKLTPEISVWNICTQADNPLVQCYIILNAIFSNKLDLFKSCVNFLPNNIFVSIVLSIQIETASEEIVIKNKCAIHEDPTYFITNNSWKPLIDTTINRCGTRKVSCKNTILYFHISSTDTKTRTDHTECFCCFHCLWKHW